MTTDSRGAAADSSGREQQTAAAAAAADLYLAAVQAATDAGQCAARLALDRLDESGTGSSTEGGTTQQRPKGT
ncbi:hypothetical protein [Streptomyces mirabilis]|uniref:hypothetical protein n=1 Tax=Streptomyces mirabilis TaxID=68239 RepID=UPI00343E2357